MERPLRLRSRAEGGCECGSAIWWTRELQWRASSPMKVVLQTSHVLGSFWAGVSFDDFTDWSLVDDGIDGGSEEDLGKTMER